MSAPVAALASASVAEPALESAGAPETAIASAEEPVSKMTWKGTPSTVRGKV
jgi:hypothetical protein